MAGINDDFWSSLDSISNGNTVFGGMSSAQRRPLFSLEWAEWDEPNDELEENEQRHSSDQTHFDVDASEPSTDVFSFSEWREPPSTYYEPMDAPSSGDMHQSSALISDNHPTQRPFLESYPAGNATLTFQSDADTLESIPNLNINIIAERCTVLAMAFEDSRSGPQLYLETLTSTTALPFLQYLYSGTYALSGITGEIYEDVPTSILFHCQLYQLGQIYDLDELKTLAYVNVLRQCEFGCSSPEKPIDLCAAIRYLYEHLSEHKRLINTILDYCVSCFLSHQLGQDEEFKDLAYELRPFHQALCMNSRDRGYEHEAAAAIIQLPFKPYVPETYASREDAATERFDHVFHFHANDALDILPKKRKRPELREGVPAGLLSKLEDYTQQDQRPQVGIEEEPGEEIGDLAFRSKRRASSSTGAAGPLPVATIAERRKVLPLRPHSVFFQSARDQAKDEGGQQITDNSQDPLMEDDPSNSDEGFEVIDRPSVDDVISETESESDCISRSDVGEFISATGPPRQTPAIAANAGSDNDSDSEWQLL